MKNPPSSTANIDHPGSTIGVTLAAVCPQIQEGTQFHLLRIQANARKDQAAVGCPPFQPSWCQTGMDFVVDWHEIGTKMSLTAYKMGVTQKSSKRDFLPPYHPIVLVPAAFLASGMHLWLVAGGPATWSTALALAMLVPAGERCKFRASLLGHLARGQEVPS